MESLRKIAILGPGLLGASLAMAVKARFPGCRVALWARRDAAVQEAREANIAEIVSSDLAPVVQDAELVILCVPVEAMAGLARQIAPLLAGDALVTDVGSVKEFVVQTAGALLPPGVFVGSHPMAGSEQSGLAAARPDLFEGAVCIITPEERDEAAYRPAVERVAAFWREIGCVTRELSPAVHDRTVALVSHLPHLIAAAQVDFVCAEDRDALKFCGNGFRDSTRIASGPAGMWTGIFASNRAALSGALKGFIARLQELSDKLDGEDDCAMETFLTRAKSTRDGLQPKAGPITKSRAKILEE